MIDTHPFVCTIFALSRVIFELKIILFNYARLPNATKLRGNVNILAFTLRCLLMNCPDELNPTAVQKTST